MRYMMSAFRGLQYVRQRKQPCFIFRTNPLFPKREFGVTIRLAKTPRHETFKQLPHSTNDTSEDRARKVNQLNETHTITNFVNQQVAVMITALYLLISPLIHVH